jgi:hypothetical protein
MGVCEMPSSSSVLNRQEGSDGTNRTRSSPELASRQYGLGPININIHMLKISAVTPLNLAWNPLLCFEGFSYAEHAIKDEDYISDLPCVLGSMSGSRSV